MEYTRLRDDRLHNHQLVWKTIMPSIRKLDVLLSRLRIAAMLLTLLLALSVGSSRADDPPGKLSLRDDLQKLEFPEGQLVTFDDGNADVAADGTITIDLHYVKRRDTARVIPGAAAVLYVTNEAQKADAAFPGARPGGPRAPHPNSPEAILQNFKAAIRTGRAGDGVFGMNVVKEPVVGMLFFEFTKHQDDRIVFSGKLPKLKFSALSPNAVAVIAYSKSRKGGALGNVIWVGLEKHEVATPSVR